MDDALMLNIAATQKKCCGNASAATDGGPPSIPLCKLEVGALLVQLG
jgi:hypothetical protein